MNPSKTANCAARGGAAEARMWYVVLYHRPTQAILGLRAYVDRDAAWDDHDRLVVEHLPRLATTEVVLLGADSLAALRITHGRYFRTYTGDISQ